ncbi:MAG: sirohydrochlorin chelatase [Cyanophyceae cyanobacterium]
MGQAAGTRRADGGCAYFLVAHGSPDPRPGGAIARLATVLAASLATVRTGFEGGELVGHGALEWVPVPLAEQLGEFGRRAAAAGRSRVKVVPLFLQAGVHARQDVPEAVAAARSPVALEVLDPVGLHPAFGGAIARWVAAIRALEGETAPLMVLAHGSRRAGGHGPVEAIAAQVGAIAAYWTVEPGWQGRAMALAQGADGGQCDRAIVLPYFLFAGSLTDAIAEALADWNRAGQGPQLRLGSAIAATEDGIEALAQVIREMVKPAPNPEI